MARVFMEDDSRKIILGDVRDGLRLLPDQSVQCVVTSPPYWSLRSYLPDEHPEKEKELGSEATPEQFVANLVAVFGEVWRVLRDDGILFVNIGDGYAGSGRGGYTGGKSGLQGSTAHQEQSRIAKGSIKPAGLHENARQNGAVGRAWIPPPSGVKRKELIGIPWKFAFAMRDAGWYIRQENIWFKVSAMPESVRDRTSRAHEQVFMFTKRERYYYDKVGGSEPSVGNVRSRDRGVNLKAKENRALLVRGEVQKNDNPAKQCNASVRRNLRSVWPMSFYPLKQKHFAAFPPELVRRCLSGATAEKGCCPKCGKPWQRIVEKRRVPTRPGTNTKVPGRNSRLFQDHDPSHPGDYKSERYALEVGNRDALRHVTETVTVGWLPSCPCHPAFDGGRESLNGGYPPVPCTVLDPFHGAGTTMLVCQRLGLRYVGIELYETYITDSLERPPIWFPGERRPRSAKPRATRVNRLQMQLELE